jgi:hypothetical protein
MTDIVPESTDYLGTGGGQWDDTGQSQEPEPVIVHIASSGVPPSRKASAEFGDCMTWSIDTFAIMGRPTMILPKRYRRTKAKIFVPIGGPLGSPAQVEGQVTSPGINANIAQITAAGLAPGTYTVQWTVELDGTVSATDVDNFKITGPGLGGGFVSANDGAVGRYPQLSFTLIVPTGNATALSIRSIAAGTVGAVYTGQISITPVAGGLTSGAVVIVNSRLEPLMQAVPIGFQIPVAPIMLEWENQKPCYAVLAPTGGGPVNVSVLDQAYEET